MSKLGEPPTGASDLAESYGLSDMAQNGLGYNWQQNFVRSALRQNFDYKGSMEKGGLGLIQNGLMHSGALDSKLPTSVASQGQNIASNAYQQAVGISDQMKEGARGLEVSLAQHQDRMDLEFKIANANLEQNEMNTWDYILQGGALAANLVSAGSGVGV